MEVLDIIECDVGPSTSCGNHPRPHESSIVPQAHEGDLCIALLRLRRPGQRINLIICAIFLFHRRVVVQTVKLPIADTVDGLGLSRFSQNSGQGITEVHCANLLALGRPQLHLVPG